MLSLHTLCSKVWNTAVASAAVASAAVASAAVASTAAVAFEPSVAMAWSQKKQADVPGIYIGT